MEFFELPEPEPEPRRERPARPPWAGPPEGVLPGVLPVELVLARSAIAAVCVSRLMAYETGFGIDLLAFAAEDRDDLDPLLFGPHRARSHGPVPGPYPPAELLRFGVQFADGGKATNTAPMRLGPGRSAQMTASRAPGSEPPAGPVLISEGGSGGERSWRQRMWVWPLPPPGPLALVCEWPAAEISLTRREIDAADLLAAAERSQAVFPAARQA